MNNVPVFNRTSCLTPSFFLGRGRGNGLLRSQLDFVSWTLATAVAAANEFDVFRVLPWWFWFWTPFSSFLWSLLSLLLFPEEVEDFVVLAFLVLGPLEDNDDDEEEWAGEEAEDDGGETVAAALRLLLVPPLVLVVAVAVDGSIASVVARVFRTPLFLVDLVDLPPIMLFPSGEEEEEDCPGIAGTSSSSLASKTRPRFFSEMTSSSDDPSTVTTQ